MLKPCQPQTNAIIVLNDHVEHRNEALQIKQPRQEVTNIKIIKWYLKTKFSFPLFFLNLNCGQSQQQDI